jgi:hypothetical protein
MFHHHPIHLFVLIYVDGIIVTDTHLLSIIDLIGSLQHELKLKDLGPLSYFLGIHVTRDLMYTLKSI